MIYIYSLMRNCLIRKILIYFFYDFEKGVVFKEQLVLSFYCKMFVLKLV